MTIGSAGVPAAGLSLAETLVPRPGTRSSRLANKRVPSAAIVARDG